MQRKPTSIAKVRYIDADTTSMSGLLRNMLGNQTPSDGPGYSCGYHGGSPNRMVIQLLGLCPKLRAIRFMKHLQPLGFGPEIWTVRIERNAATRSDASRPVFGQSPGDKAHVDHTISHGLSLSSPPPSKPFACPEPPSALFTITTRFDFTFTTGRDGSYRAYADRWITALREHPSFARIYKQANFGVLPIALDDIGALYQRQIDGGWANRLEVITAPRIESWSLHQFDAFGSLCGSTLTTLILADKYTPSNTEISFNDIPELTTTIERLLPLLRVFHVSMSGI